MTTHPRLSFHQDTGEIEDVQIYSDSSDSEFPPQKRQKLDNDVDAGEDGDERKHIAFAQFDMEVDMSDGDEVPPGDSADEEEEIYEDDGDEGWETVEDEDDSDYVYESPDEESEGDLEDDDGDDEDEDDDKDEDDDEDNGDGNGEAEVDTDISHFPIPCNETSAQRSSRLALTFPVMLLIETLRSQRDHQTTSDIMDRCLPSLCTARFYPHLSLPRLHTYRTPITDNTRFSLHTREIFVCSGIQAHSSSIWFPQRMQVDKKKIDVPAVLKVAFDLADMENSEAEYRVYYSLLRSGRFKLDFFETYNSTEPLPPTFTYPDAIAWPYGLFLAEETDDYRPEDPMLLLLPSTGPSLINLRRGNHNPLSEGAKNALVKTLEKVHQAGYLHGSINAGTIHVILQTGIAVLTTFSLAKACEDEARKQEEMQQLLEVLAAYDRSQNTGV